MAAQAEDLGERGSVRRRGKIGLLKGEVDAMALGIDLAPTLLEMAGTKPVAPMHGRSLVPLLKRKDVPWRTSFLIEYYSDHTMERMLKMGYQAVRTET